MIKSLGLILAGVSIFVAIMLVVVGGAWLTHEIVGDMSKPTADTTTANTNIVWMTLRPDQVFYAEPDGTTNYMQVGFDPLGYMRWRVGTTRKRRALRPDPESPSDPPKQPSPSKAEMRGVWTQMNILEQLMAAAPASEIDGMLPDRADACGELLGMKPGEYAPVRDYAKLVAMMRRRWAEAMLDQMTRPWDRKA